MKKNKQKNRSLIKEIENEYLTSLQEKIFNKRNELDKAEEQIKNQRQNTLNSDENTILHKEYVKQKHILQEMRKKKIRTLIETIPVISQPSTNTFKVLTADISSKKEYFSSMLGNADDQMTLASSLGIIAMILKAVSLYLNIPLLYEINPKGSQSEIMKDK